MKTTMLKKILSLLLSVMLLSISLGGALAEAQEVPPLDEYLTLEQEPDPNNAGQRSVTLSYTPFLRMKPTEREISLYLLSPAESTHDITLSLMLLGTDEQGEETETLIAESGRIPAGYSIYRMILNEDVEIPEKGAYDARIHVNFYSTETGEKVELDFRLNGMSLIVEP